MKALSISQPWAAVIAAGFKTIENRGWKPPAFMMGQTFAIHAAKSYDPDAADALTRMLVSERWRGAPNLEARGAIIGFARLVRVVESSDDPLFFGPFGLVLADAVAIAEPIPCRGALGFWAIPPEVMAKIKAPA